MTLHIEELADLSQASANPAAADVGLVYLPPATPIDQSLQAVLNAGDRRDVKDLIQDMRAAYQAQREAWKAIANHYRNINLP